MRGDFSRDSYNPLLNFSRVLMQQGRVQLDADWNEQVAILLDYMRTLAADLIGPYGGPQAALGFQVIADPRAFISALPEEQRRRLAEELERRDLLDLDGGDFLIGPGRYYVDGVLCSNGAFEAFTRQPGRRRTDPPRNETRLVFLEVWERHVSWIEAPDIHDPALGAVDTTTRAQVVWRVRAVNEPIGDVRLPENPTREQGMEYWDAWLARERGIARGTLAASVAEGAKLDNPCTLSPESRYRGPENQLYRVEVHRGGTLAGPGEPGGDAPTFKWSRDNGSVAVGVLSARPGRVTVASLGREGGLGLSIGSLVELTDDDRDLGGEPGPLFTIADIDSLDMVVSLEGDGAGEIAADAAFHPLLRRWDGYGEMRAGAPIALEDGIQVQFSPGEYRSGDYWLLPARTNGGGLLWPRDAEGRPAALPPHGIVRHYAPLATISAGRAITDLRCTISPIGCDEDRDGRL